TDVVSTEVFAYRPGPLIEVLERLADEHGDGDDLPEDYGESLLPTLVEERRAHAYRLEGYWRDVGTVASYWTAHRDLVCQNVPELDDRDWPILTLAPERPPARLGPTAEVDHALVSPGCVVDGRVVRSVLGPGVVVAEGALVRDSVLFEDCVVESGAVVDTAILDREAQVGKDARVGAESAGAEGVTLLGAGASVPAGETVGAGGRVPR
ncbi:MAG: sugar phosphate nucleotidyltransferase, partial [Acidimicrobiales bacterium]